MRSPTPRRLLFLLSLLLALAGTAVLALAPARAEEEPSPWDRLKGMDRDGDGRVTRDEFRGRARLFERLDADGDGAVTEAEARAAQGVRREPPTEGAARPTPEASGLPLALLDADGDGTVSRAEWTAFFAAADRNGDGVVTAPEWQAILRPPSRVGGKAPALGEKAPAVRAATLDGDAAVDLARPKRATVLVFGSWT